MSEALANLLIERGKVSELDLERAKSVLSSSGEQLSQILVKLGMVAERDVANLQVELFDYDLVTEDDYPEEPILEDQISKVFLKESHILPLADDGACLHIACLNPADTFATKALSLATQREVKTSLALASELESAYERLYGRARSEMDQMVDAAESEAYVDNDTDDVERLKDMASDAPVIRMVNHIFNRALEARASDIHIEPFENTLKVRYRIDGVLQEVEAPSSKLASAVISRIKILSRLNIAERRVPQDGRIKLKIAGKEVDLRVSTVPTLYGESVVMRILDKESINLDLDSIGLSQKVLADFKQVLEKPNGILLVTGPTGSGKTTTLYSALSRMNTTDRKILTVEDPVEYQIAGVNQIHVAPKIGLDFASALRAIVRQDPDVIMIGEMRDKETANIAIQSALTGHIVFSTLHTNDAASGVTRLLDMGLEDYLLTSTVNAILAQRLLRVLCPHCKSHDTLSTEQVEHLGIENLVSELGMQDLHKAEGCSECSHTGYMGRMGVHEFLIVNDALRHLVLEHASAEVIHRQAVANGMVTLYNDGMRKALQGDTSIAEVLRITQQSDEE